MSKGLTWPLKPWTCVCRHRHHRDYPYGTLRIGTCPTTNKCSCTQFRRLTEAKA